MAIHLKPVNWRLLALHLLGVPFLVLGMRELFLIQQVWLMRLVLRYGQEVWYHLPAGYPISQMVSELAIREPLATLLAILLGCVLLSIIIWRQRESWLLPVLLFIGGYYLGCCRFYILGGNRSL